MALTVSKPEVSVEGISGYQFVAEKPIRVSCTSVSFPDGSALSPEQAQQFGFRLYRRLETGVDEAWSETDKSWMPAAAAPRPEPLAFIENTWQTVLAPMGLQDDTGRDKFSTDPTSGFPKYFVRCFFSATDTAGQCHDGISPFGNEFTVSPAGALNRAGLATVPMAITQATEIRIFLKDAARISERGVIAIRQSGGDFEIDLTVGAARVRMTGAGGIELDGEVSIQGSLKVNGTTMLVP
jgi:hypothetical protein